MNDFKSKLPDLHELGSMTSKLFKGIKTSVEEIIQDYKQKRAQPESEQNTTKNDKTSEVNSTSTVTKEAKKPKESTKES